MHCGFECAIIVSNSCRLHEVERQVVKHLICDYSMANLDKCLHWLHDYMNVYDRPKNPRSLDCGHVQVKNHVTLRAARKGKIINDENIRPVTMNANVDAQALC